MKPAPLAALLALGAFASACGPGGGGSSSGTSSGGNSSTSSSSRSSSTAAPGGTSGGSASTTRASSSGSTSSSGSVAAGSTGSTGSSGGSSSTGGAGTTGSCTPGSVLAAFQPCTSGSDCNCPQVCVDPGIGTLICQTPCATTAFGSACQVVTAGDGTCQPAQITDGDGGTFTGFCIPNGIQVSDWNGGNGAADCSLVTVEQFPSAGTSNELCVAGLICPAIQSTCSTFCTTPGQAGNCGAGLQCNFLYAGVSSAGYCGTCATSGNTCIVDSDCCSGLSCTMGTCQ
jgi:hypothetical protein